MFRKNRRRGAQPGNHNALKHGLYSKVRVTRRTDNVPDRAAITELDHDIALTRATLKRLFAKDPYNLKLITYTMSLQERFLRTRRRFIERDRRAKLRRSRAAHLAPPANTSQARNGLRMASAGSPYLHAERERESEVRETNRAQAAQS